MARKHNIPSYRSEYGTVVIGGDSYRPSKKSKRLRPKNKRPSRNKHI